MNEVKELPECEGCRRDNSRNCARCSGTGNEPKKVIADVWACPECGGYYASSTAGDLEAKVNTKLNSNEATHNRAQCPYCKTPRKKLSVLLLIPLESAKVGA